MKKLLIVNNNMKVGGVQKSLLNLLWSIDTEKEYDVTLLLFSKTGPWVRDIPESVRVIESSGPFRYLGRHQSEFKVSFKDTLIRGALAGASRIFGRAFILRQMMRWEPPLEESFDCAVAYLHNGRKNSFYGGVQDYVLGCVKAEKKVAFIHGDYRSCGAHNVDNVRLLEKFDLIAACSDGCRRSLESALPHMKGKCLTVRNFHRFDLIKKEAEKDPADYGITSVNAVAVARLTHEKAIDRSVRAIHSASQRGLDVKLYIVGSGPKKDELSSLADELGEGDSVIFCGEQTNPYRYMRNADLLLLSSYHEAAPMVIDEARCLGVPVLTTETTSSSEMVLSEGCGVVCENTDEAFIEAFCRTASDRDALRKLKKELLARPCDNRKAEKELDSLFKRLHQE